MSTWVKCQLYLFPVQSPLACFIHHPGFREASSASNFQRWVLAWMDKIGKSGSESVMIMEEQVIEKIGTFPGQSYQFMQLRHFLDMLLKITSIFWSLIPFEGLLDSGITKGQGSVLEPKGLGKDLGYHSKISKSV